MKKQNMCGWYCTIYPFILYSFKVKVVPRVSKKNSTYVLNIVETAETLDGVGEQLDSFSIIKVTFYNA